jgi:hypothetical protein
VLGYHLQDTPLFSQLRSLVRLLPLLPTTALPSLLP